MLAHRVHQAANDAARAAITGLDADDRRGIAIRAVDRSLASVAGVSSDTRSVAVSETSEAIPVAVAFTVPAGDFLRSSLVPSPRPVIEASRSEEHTSELQSLMRISYAVFCLTKKQTIPQTHITTLPY